MQLPLKKLSIFSRRQAGIGFHHFLLESDEKIKTILNNPVNPV